jgi:hypothetical protein
MGVLNFEDETTSIVAPAKLYKALVTDADVLTPKVIPDIKSVEIVEGNGGAGTIKKLTYVEGQYKNYMCAIVYKYEIDRFGPIYCVT